jgi:hypothetical protein
LGGSLKEQFNLLRHNEPRVCDDFDLIIGPVKNGAGWQRDDRKVVVKKLSD